MYFIVLHIHIPCSCIFLLLFLRFLPAAFGINPHPPLSVTSFCCTDSLLSSCNSEFACQLRVAGGSCILPYAQLPNCEAYQHDPSCLSKESLLQRFSILIVFVLTVLNLNIPQLISTTQRLLTNVIKIGELLQQSSRNVTSKPSTNIHKVQSSQVMVDKRRKRSLELLSDFSRKLCISLSDFSRSFLISRIRACIYIRLPLLEVVSDLLQKMIRIRFSYQSCKHY